MVVSVNREQVGSDYQLFPRNTFYSSNVTGTLEGQGSPLSYVPQHAMNRLHIARIYEVARLSRTHNLK